MGARLRVEQFGIPASRPHVYKPTRCRDPSRRSSALGPYLTLPPFERIAGGSRPELGASAAVWRSLSFSATLLERFWRLSWELDPAWIDCRRCRDGRRHSLASPDLAIGSLAHSLTRLLRAPLRRDNDPSRVPTMASHSPSSSLADADFDYYPTYSHSATSSRTDASAPPAPQTGISRSQSQTQSQTHTRRKTNSLSKITVPSFSAFRSQVSSIPISSSPAKKKPPFQAHSPRAPSLSVAERASPRLADPGTRPLSLDSPVRQSSGLARVDEDTPTPHEERYVGHPHLMDQD